MIDDDTQPEFVERRAPDYFDDLISRAIEELPPEFRSQLESVAIVVDDYPTQDQLTATHSHGLFGIYQGVPRTAYGADYAAEGVGRHSFLRTISEVVGFAIVRSRLAS